MSRLRPAGNGGAILRVEEAPGLVPGASLLALLLWMEVKPGAHAYQS